MKIRNGILAVTAALAHSGADRWLSAEDIERWFVLTIDALAAEGAVGVPLRPRTQLMTAVRAFVEQKMRKETGKRDEHANP